MRNSIICSNCSKQVYRPKSETYGKENNFCSVLCYKLFRIKNTNINNTTGNIPNHLYGSIHTWIIKNFGRAQRCENENCCSSNPKRFEWALRKGFVYDFKIENFMQLCPSCHRKYDETEERKLSISKSLTNKPANNAKIILNTQTGIFYSNCKEAADSEGLKRSTLCAMLIGQNKNKTNFIYA